MLEYPVAQGLAGQPGADDLRRHDRDHEGDHRPWSGAVSETRVPPAPSAGSRGPERCGNRSPLAGRPVQWFSPNLSRRRSGARPESRRSSGGTLRLLFTTQIIGGIGVAIGLSVGALLAARMAGIASPASRRAPPSWARRCSPFRSRGSCAAPGAGPGWAGLPRRRGRRRRRGGGDAPDSVPLLFVGLLLFGGGTAANLQARYAAVDLAAPERRGRQLSLVVWATTIGAVAGAPPRAARRVRSQGVRPAGSWPARSCSARSRSSSLAW